MHQLQGLCRRLPGRIQRSADLQPSMDRRGNTWNMAKTDGSFSAGAMSSLRPSCIVRVCPTGASYQREDGIVVVNESDCVGCRYCMIACPYDARFFREDKGVVEKCDFCVKRLARGQPPACVETCPSKVRIFGDLNDPKSKLAELIAGRQYRLKKPEAGTGPQIYYLM